MNQISKLFTKVKTSVKTNIQNGLETARKNFDESKKKPVSKRRAFLLGFTTVTSLFGIAMFGPMLPAIAKDLPNNPAKPGGVVPTPPSSSPSTEMIGKIGSQALGTFVGGICAAAATGAGVPLIFGALCGFLVATGMIINNPGKSK